MRLSDAERERLFEILKRHAAQGRLSTPELERRVEVVARAEDDAQARAALVDLPPLAPAAPPGTSPRRAPGRGHAETSAPQPGWQSTEERFRDPRTRRVMRVWVDEAGARHYVAEDI